MNDFDGIDRSTAASFARTAEPAPLNIELIKAGFAKMMAWRQPPPMPVHITDEVGVIIWSRYCDEIDRLRDRRLSGEAMARELALTTLLDQETVRGFVAWMETALERARIHGDATAISSKVAELTAEQQTRRLQAEPTGMRRTPIVKPTPPVPPWARERRRHRQSR